MAGVITSQLVANGVDPVEVTVSGGGAGGDVNVAEVGGATVTAGAGAVAAGTQRITLASDDPAVSSLGTIATNTGNSSTSLGVIDDWDESDRAKVNPIVGQAGVQGGSGAVSATTQRVVLATDVALPAGTNAIGKLAANSGIDIGDVDVTSVIPGTGATNQGKAVDSAAGATDTGVAALVVRDDVLATLTPADNDYTHLRVNSKGATWTIPDKTNTATLANVASSASNVTLQASNTSRIGLTIFNDSAQSLFVKYGATASSSSFTVKILAGGYWEMPQPIYTGIVDGIWVAADGSARMTEFT